MAVITNYATLLTAVSDYLARSDLSTFIPNFVQNAENKLYRTLNLRHEETALSVSISSSVAAVPAAFKALKFAYYDAAPIQLLGWVPVEDLYREYPSTATGRPKKISREGANFVFGPRSQDGTLKGIYYSKTVPLRTTDGNWYITNAPELLLYAALLEAAPFIKDDPRIQVWSGLFLDAKQTVLDEEAASSASRGQLRTRSAGNAP